MNKTTLTIALATAILTPVAFAHDTVGMQSHPKHNATPSQTPAFDRGYQQGVNFQQDLNNKLHQGQQQDQYQTQRATSYSGAGAAGYSLNTIEGNRSNVTVNEGSDAHHYNHNVNNVDNSRELTIIPVNVQAPPSMNPAAHVSRMAGGECGPRMKILMRPVYGVNNRFFGASKVELGSDDTLISANEPYRYVTLPNGDVQMLGHRIVETTAALNTSSAYGFGAGGNSSTGSAGSLGVSSSGGMQRLVTSIRLVDCVAGIVRKAPIRPVVASQPVAKAIPPARPVKRAVARPAAPVRRIDPKCGCAR